MLENSTAHIMRKNAYKHSVAQDGRNECAIVYKGDLYNMSGTLDVIFPVSNEKHETSYSRIASIHPALIVITDAERVAIIIGIMKLEKINIFPIFFTPNFKTRSSCTTKEYLPNAKIKELNAT